ncbi:response regulator [Gelidibacter maritimus]|uniref:Response regulator n=1 Tax=Gelidibacter maritimus TaxID=2761487 RepID=A0A7W2R310_9FLAO|nr:response regulator [Gelidibacter maritimus]MBA6152337.1 response regulator [Gelidibacter maritimus]
MKKILLIEDDAVLRDNTAELLELLSYQVDVAANGLIGVEKAKNVHPDLIVCDIMMPELDGYGVLEQLAKNDHTKHIPFIFLSAKTERQDVRKGMNLGADDYITKPFSEDELVSAIESRLAKAAILQEIRGKETHLAEEDNTDELNTLSDLKSFFEVNGTVYDFKKGEVIYEEGQNSNIIFLINKGIVKSYKLDEQGKELTTALYKASDIFGYTSFLQNIPYQETSTALENTEAVGISKEELKKILDKNPHITYELIELLTDDLKGVKDQLLQMAYSSVQKKTASTILKFAEKIDPKAGASIKISRSDLASVAGIATETLIRTISNFRKDGLIEIEGRNIKILDLKKLQEIY